MDEVKTATAPFGVQLKLARLAAGLTQEQLAERTRVAVSTIRLYENSEAKPSWERGRQLLGYLEEAIRRAPEWQKERATLPVKEQLIDRMLFLMEGAGLTMIEAEDVADELVKAVDRLNAEAYEKMLFHREPSPEVSLGLLRNVAKSLAKQLNGKQCEEILAEFNILPQTEEGNHDKD